MAGWRVLLLPPAGMERARPRWLAADGRFTLDQRRAWLAMDCSSAVVRLQRWLKLKNRHIVYLKRMRLVHSRSITAAEAGWLEQKSVGCS